MTQRTVRHVLNLPGRYVAGSQEVAIRLCVPGVTSDQVMILDRQHVKTSAATGAFQITLDPNTSIDPPDTFYIAALFDADQTQIPFVVPDDEPPHDSDHLIPGSDPAAYAWLLTDLTVDDPTLPGAIYLGINTADDDITASGRNLPLFTTPGGVAKVWTPRQFGWQPDTDATAALLAMVASGEQHFDLGAEHYDFDDIITFGEGVNLDGRGGKGKGVDRGPTCFIAQSAGAQIKLRSAGFGAHRFMIDGNNLAVNPLYIGGGGTGDVGAQPDLTGVCVMQAAAGGAAVTVDGTQNGRVFDLTLLNNAGEGLKFTAAGGAHPGGWDIYGLEITGSGAHNIHITNSGHLTFWGGTIERNASTTLSDILIDGVVWFPKIRFSGLTCSTGGSVAAAQRPIIEHRATGALIVDGVDFGCTALDVPITVQGVADGTHPVAYVSNIPYPTGPDTTGFYELDSAAVVYQVGEIGGQVAAAGMPLHTPTSNKASLIRISRDLPSVYPLSADGPVTIDLSAGKVHLIQKNGHKITGLSAANGYDGQTFELSIQEGATVAPGDTLPGSGSSWLWHGGDTNKMSTMVPLGVVTARFVVKSGFYTQVAPTAQRDSLPVYTPKSQQWVTPPHFTTAVNLAATSGTIYGVPLPVRKGVQIDQVGVTLATVQSGGGSSTVTIGLYPDDGTGTGPAWSIPIATGTIDPTTGAGTDKLVAAATTLAPGLYWTTFLLVNGGTPPGTPATWTSGNAVDGSLPAAHPYGGTRCFTASGQTQMPTTTLALSPALASCPIVSVRAA